MAETLQLPAVVSPIPAVIRHQAELLLRGRFPSWFNSKSEVRFARMSWFEVPSASTRHGEFWASFEVVEKQSPLVTSTVQHSGAIWFWAPVDSPGIPSKVKFFETVA